MFKQIIESVELNAITRSIIAAAGAATIVMTATPAYAQKSEQTPDDDAVENIVVTAQKRSERLQDVPISIDVLNASKLAESGKAKLADFYTEIPGLSYIQSQMSSAIIMRGIGTDAGISIRPTAGTTIDDVPYGSATNTGVSPDLDPSDLQQIEVLRGPQGTLYGASSMGGLLKYITRDPDLTYSEGRMELGGATAAHGGDGYSLRLSGSTPVTDDFGVRASVFKREDPYFVTNTRDGADNSTTAEGGRFAALWQITDKVSFRGSAMIQNNGQGQSATIDSSYDLTPEQGQYSHTRMVGADKFEGTTRFYSARLNADLGWATFDSITGYSEHRSAAKQDVGYTTIGDLAPVFAGILGLTFENPGAQIDNRYNVDKISEELRLSSPEQQLMWQVGLFYTKEDVNSTQNFYLGDNDSGEVFTGVPLLISLGDNEYEESAVFANVTYAITDKLDVTAGGRYAENELSGFGEAGGMLSSASTTTNKSDDSVFTYLLSTRYKFEKDMMGYIRIASGYRAGGSNSNLLANAPESYTSDELVSYELGFKGSFLDNDLRMDSALFYIDWSDLQLTQLDLEYGSTYTANAGKAVSQGIELSLDYDFAEDWLFAVNYSFTDAKLAEDIPGFVEGSTAYGLDGDQLPFTGKHGGTMAVSHFIELNNGVSLSLEAKLRYTDDRQMEFTQSAELPRIQLPGYTTADLSANFSKDDWKVTLYVNNVTDEVGYVTANRRSSAALGTDVTYGPTLIQPRTVGATLAYQF
ncbi:TonB-dependent receptor [Alteromonas sp. 1_MG-2023]|uniref:TonB-dependent receptor n=1 Tax=Alteromonas sp. 1_MG-2023 TaxID=3062669 RepID=UPI0026E470F9|nr:TonB-dependent receptor [Alteromonas sp. 1_MG-2023]MDO6474111.1 TonB-dependent receptor [Alteromonas sp. 1_MG-2023]